MTNIDAIALNASIVAIAPETFFNGGEWLTIDRPDLGNLPQIFNSQDKRPARAQAEESGWNPIDGISLDTTNLTLGDEKLIAALYLPLTDEMIMLFPSSKIAIIDLTADTAEIARMN